MKDSLSLIPKYIDLLEFEYEISSKVQFLCAGGAVVMNNPSEIFKIFKE